GRLLYAPQPAWVGASPAATSYQWRRNGGDVAGATSAEYLLHDADQGAQITVAVTATSLAGARTVVSAPAGPVVAAVPYITSLPTISGTAQQGQTLTATTGSWASSPASFAFQWRRCDASG